MSDPRAVMPTYRIAGVAATAVAVAMAVLAPVASAAVAQPPQPKAGPGGSDYAHRGWRVSSGGTGYDAWYVFEPVRPRPAKAPLAVVMHGYGEYAGFDQMHELIRHTVRKGSIVIYPRWQTAIATTELARRLGLHRGSVNRVLADERAAARIATCNGASGLWVDIDGSSTRSAATGRLSADQAPTIAAARASKAP